MATGVAGFRADRMRKARVKAGLSYRQLARQLNMSASGVIGYEMGRVAPYPANLKRLADALGCATTYLAPLPRRPTLTDLRERAGLNLTDIGRTLGEHSVVIWRIEQGLRRPYDPQRWADAYGLDLDTLQEAWDRAAGTR